MYCTVTNRKEQWSGTNNLYPLSYFITNGFVHPLSYKLTITQFPNLISAECGGVGTYHLSSCVIFGVLKTLRWLVRRGWNPFKGQNTRNMQIKIKVTFYSGKSTEAHRKPPVSRRVRALLKDRGQSVRYSNFIKQHFYFVRIQLQKKKLRQIQEACKGGASSRS